ncbi:MAG: hypothetical protein V3U54_13160 [Thermodesulfobacteriota bacterium]
MASPTIVFKYNSNTEASPTWTDILAAETITFTGAGSTAGNLKPIPVPSGGDVVRIADELWIDKGTDAEITLYDAGGQETDSFTVDMFASNPTNTNVLAIQADTNPETQAAELEAWDDTSFNATTKEILDGGASALGVHSQLRAVETSSNVTPGAGAGSMPAAYQSQTAQTTTYQLQGDTRKITFTTALSAGNQNRIAIHLFVMDDSTAGVETVELTYRFFFT